MCVKHWRRNKMYVYLHENGEYIKKPDIVVESIGEHDYFDSPLVKRWWYFKTKEEANLFVKQKELEKT